MKTIAEYLQSGHITPYQDSHLISKCIRKHRPNEEVIDEYVGIETCPVANVKMYIKYDDLIQFNCKDILAFVDNYKKAVDQTSILFTLPRQTITNKLFGTAVVYELQTHTLKSSPAAAKAKNYQGLLSYFFN